MSLGTPETFQHYGILRRDDGSLWELGRGAMGVTYKAIDNNLHSPVALKVIHGLFFHEERVRERFVREARAAASLRHRNVASIYHLGQEAESFFYAMEYIEGETLAGVIDREGPLSWRDALAVALQVTRALMAAHARQVVHRDIKPANIMLVHEPGEDARTVKLIDFGLAKTLAEEPGALLKLSGSGFLGTPLYASPEQCEELTPDIRSDIYSLGVTLWHALAGQPPFNGTLASVFNAHLHADLPWDGLPAEVPYPVRMLLWRMLAKAPAERFQTPADLRAGIDACLHGEEISAVPATPPAEPAVPVPIRRIKPKLVVEPAADVPTNPRPTRIGWKVTVAAALPVLLAGVLVALASAVLRPSAKPTAATGTPTLPATPADPPKPVATPMPPVASVPAPAVTSAPVPAAKLTFPENSADPAARTFRTHAADWMSRQEKADHSASLLREARAHMAALRWSQGADAYQEVLRLQPESLEALAERAAAYRNLGRTTEARAEANRAILVTPTDTLEAFYHAFAYETLGRTLDAHTNYQTALLALSSDHGWESCDYRLRGRAYVELGRFDAAIADFSEAIRLDGTDARAYLLRANAYAQIKNTSRAMEDCEAAVGIAPHNAYALSRRGAILAGLGMRAQAAESFNEALALDPHNAVSLTERGFMYVFWSDFARAGQDFRDAVLLDPSRGEIHVGLGDVDYAQGRRDAAVADLNEALRLDPDNLTGLIMRGMALTASGRYGPALADLDRAVRVAPGASYVYGQRGLLFATQKQFDRAVREYRQAVELDPTNTQAQFSLCHTYMDLHQYDQALDAYDRALRLNPNVAALYNDRAAVLVQLRQYPRAMEDLNESIRLDANAPLTYRNRAILERRLGRHADADRDDAHAAERQRAQH